MDNRRRRILFRATHRGTYENDILIGNFVRARLRAFTESDMDALEEVMELPDAMLADWLTGRQPIPADVDTPMLRAIRRAAEDGEGQPAGGKPPGGKPMGGKPMGGKPMGGKP